MMNNNILRNFCIHQYLRWRFKNKYSRVKFSLHIEIYHCISMDIVKHAPSELQSSMEQRRFSFHDKMISRSNPFLFLLHKNAVKVQLSPKHDNPIKFVTVTEFTITQISIKSQSTFLAFKAMYNKFYSENIVYFLLKWPMHSFQLFS